MVPRNRHFTGHRCLCFYNKSWSFYTKRLWENKPLIQLNDLTVSLKSRKRGTDWAAALPDQSETLKRNWTTSRTLKITSWVPDISLGSWVDGWFHWGFTPDAIYNITLKAEIYSNRSSSTLIKCWYDRDSAWEFVFD